MTRRLIFVWVGLVIGASAAQAQIPFSKNMVPTRTTLARLGLERNWYNVIPLAGGAEQVAEISIDLDMVFAQTNQANFHAFDSESGRHLWTANLGVHSVDAHPASANATTVFVTNSNMLFAIDRKTGLINWKRQLSTLAGGSTACDDMRVWVGTLDGKINTYKAADGGELWSAQTRGEVTSRPHPAEHVVAVASQDGRVYIYRAEFNTPLMTWAARGPITAPLGAYSTRTLLVPSQDKSLYAIDLFTGETKWVFASGSPINQEPLVSGEDVYIVNTAGNLSRINGKSGAEQWTISTLGGPLLGVTAKRVYLESRDGDLFIVDRNTGHMLFDPRATHERAGLNIRDFQLGPTNRLNDRIYIASKNGMLVCLRESGAIKPVPLRDPKEKPFGYIPPEGIPEDQPPAPTPPPSDAPKAEDKEKADAAAEPKEDAPAKKEQGADEPK